MRQAMCGAVMVSLALAAGAGQAGESELAQAGRGGGYAVEDRMNGLEQQITTLTGQVEELQLRLQALTAKFEKFATDMEFRMNQGGGPGGPGGPPPQMGGRQPAGPPGGGSLAPPGSGGGNPQAGNSSGNAQADYDGAFQMLQHSDFAGAEQAFRAFVARYPKHELAGNAQYWLGESFYARKDYQNAAVAFADGYKNYPKSPKGPDTLLKLGMSLSALNKNPDACAVYDRLSKDYPKATEFVKRRVAEERRKSKCA